MRYLPILFFFSLNAKFHPWGKDEGLRYTAHTTSSEESFHTGHLAAPLIKFHKKVISKADGPRSNFVPNSSQYTLDAMNKYGLAKGLLMGCDRLQRENKQRWVYRTTLKPDGTMMKWDPVE